MLSSCAAFRIATAFVAGLRRLPKPNSIMSTNNGMTNSVTVPDWRDSQYARPCDTTIDSGFRRWDQRTKRLRRTLRVLTWITTHSAKKSFARTLDHLLKPTFVMAGFQNSQTLAR